MSKSDSSYVGLYIRRYSFTDEVITPFYWFRPTLWSSPCRAYVIWICSRRQRRSRIYDTATISCDRNRDSPAIHNQDSFVRLRQRPYVSRAVTKLDVGRPMLCPRMNLHRE